MKTANAILAASRTDPGLQRSVNEDRCHFDATRGILVVIDGVGGQAAGGKAADVALSMLRSRLERQTGTTAQRIREAITIANNEIFRLALTRPEWNGMACVLTVAIVENGIATIGHVGDTRLYKLRDNRIEKVTKDHSPVGEREDSGEISELQAMRHPRRNEVYRDVGSEPHDGTDSDFIDIEEIPFEPDAALLLCSDGLTDLVDSSTIADIARGCAGDPETVTRSLIDAANAAGGKDNVTVVYAEGDRFAATQSATRSLCGGQGVPAAGATTSPNRDRRSSIRMVACIVAGFAVGLATAWFVLPGLSEKPPASANLQVVRPAESIAAAIQRAQPGTEIVVEPGEYRERLILKEGVRLVSRVPRGATLRLPSSIADTDAGPAVIADGLTNAELVGFRIVGDAATPLSVGIGAASGGLSVMDVEITGATKAAIDFGPHSSATLFGSEIHDNPGAAVIIRALATPHFTSNVFTRNGMSEQASGSLVIEEGSTPDFQRNVFVGLGADISAPLNEVTRASFKQRNWFIPVHETVRPGPTTVPGRTGTP